MKESRQETKKKLLSVIVPAYKQSRTIQKDLKRIESTLKQIRYNYELICVVDGKEDKTYRNACRVRSEKVQVIGYRENKGKGHAVRFGMIKSQGDLVAFIDAGMEIDPNGISLALEHLEWYNADIIIGSKRHPASQVKYPLDRRIVSRFYQLFVRLFTGLNVRDTQAGLKIFRREVLEVVLPRLMVRRYAFDLEILTVAHRFGYTKIFEAPVKLSYNFTDLTHAVCLKDFFKSNGLWKSFVDTLAIIYRLKILRYYDRDLNSGLEGGKVNDHLL
ncbi:glycosyltransferase [Patescibacteria group bacterium]